MHMMQHDVVCVVGHTPRERVDLSKKNNLLTVLLGPFVPSMTCQSSS